ncbi:hypothetical protein [Aeromonas media]|uniref:hypothetical protein n=1 Tax=Aeromonas media TaxID=651 RepID=UPI003D1E938D
MKNISRFREHAAFLLNGGMHVYSRLMNELADAYVWLTAESAKVHAMIDHANGERQMDELADGWLDNDIEKGRDASVARIRGITINEPMIDRLFESNLPEQANAMRQLGRAYEILATHYAKLLVDNGFCETMESSLDDADRWLNPKRRPTGSDE